MDQNRTVLFADVRDSTGLTEKLGDVVSRQLIGTLMEELEATTIAHGGSVIKRIGDEIMVAFEEPGEAARAAIRMQRNLLGRPPVSGVRPQVGIGLNAGPVVMEDGDLFGDVVIVAARLVSNAVATQILTTGDTLAAVGDPDIVSRSLGGYVVKGREEPVDLCEILWRRFRRSGRSPGDLDDAALSLERKRHMGALVDVPVLSLGFTLAVAVGATCYFWIWFLPMIPGEEPLAAKVLLAVANGINLTFLVWFLVMACHRSLVRPMNRIMANDLAFMLAKGDFRTWFLEQEETRADVALCRCDPGSSRDGPQRTPAPAMLLRRVSHLAQGVEH